MRQTLTTMSTKTTREEAMTPMKACFIDSSVCTNQRKSSEMETRFMKPTATVPVWKKGKEM